jgi:hypothetical protein
MNLTSVFVSRVFNKNEKVVNNATVPFNGPYKSCGNVETYRNKEINALNKYYENLERESENSLNNFVIRNFNVPDEDDRLMQLYGEALNEDVFTVEDEQKLLKTYHIGGNYIDKNQNQIFITFLDHNNGKVTFIRNKYLGKMKNDEITLNRTMFLEMMGFTPGTISEDI